MCARNVPGITHSSQHDGTSWKRAAEGQSFGLMLQLDLPVANQDINPALWVSRRLVDLRRKPLRRSPENSPKSACPPNMRSGERLCAPGCNQYHVTKFLPRSVRASRRCPSAFLGTPPLRRTCSGVRFYARKRMSRSWRSTKFIGCKSRKSGRRVCMIAPQRGWASPTRYPSAELLSDPSGVVSPSTRESQNTQSPRLLFRALLTEGGDPRVQLHRT